MYGKGVESGNQILIWMKAVGRLPDIPTVHQCVSFINDSIYDVHGVCEIFVQYLYKKLSAFKL